MRIDAVFGLRLLGYFHIAVDDWRAFIGMELDISQIGFSPLCRKPWQLLIIYFFMTVGMNQLLSELQALELELHHPGIPSSVTRLQQLLHKDFSEVGRSGRAYDRETVVRCLSEQKVAPAVMSDAFALVQLAPDVALLTYRSAHQKPDGMFENHSLRSSVWVRIAASWQLRYHQGTPAAQPW